uniref:Dynamin-like GTPase OPA1 C-terminal domain-containing protein n=1 Tax=Biomphalaria glabrata TaxID=6526 RepID=A0A2C9LS67_BIOGL
AHGINASLDVIVKGFVNLIAKIGWDTLHEQFTNLLEQSKKSKDYDQVFDMLKSAVVQMTKTKHDWESKAEDSLRVMQLNTLEDRSVHDKEQWDKAAKFMEDTMKERLAITDSELEVITGPNLVKQWVKWTKRTEEHVKASAVKTELEKLLNVDPTHSSHLAPDELTTVRRNLLNQSFDVDADK